MEQIETYETTDSINEVDVKVVNRSVVVAYLNESFYAWHSEFLEQTEPQDKILETPYTFLTPPFENEDEVDEYISDNSLVFLEAILEEHIDDEELLNDALTDENFENWIDYDFSIFIMDSATDYELAHESLADEDMDESDTTTRDSIYTEVNP
jgi:hypothetical protein